MATNKPRPAILEDPVRSSHPDVDEPNDWRDRGVSSDLTTKLVFGQNNDLVAYTRFGFGWGPVEVTREYRGCDENGITRVIGIYVAGELVSSIFVYADGEHINAINDNRVAVRDAGQQLEPALVVQDHTAKTTTKTELSEDVVARLRDLTAVFKTDLTDKRREKKYVTRAMVDAIDDLVNVVDQL